MYPWCLLAFFFGLLAAGFLAKQCQYNGIWLQAELDMFVRDVWCVRADKATLYTNMFGMFASVELRADLVDLVAQIVIGHSARD